MEITDPEPFAASVQSGSPDWVRLIAMPGAAVPIPEVTTNIHAVIGPEGGFSPDELALASELGWQPVSLGSRILRIETAAVAVASCVGCRS